MWKKWLGFRTKSSQVVPDYEGLDAKRLPKHIAIIMDGNGRWAQKRGLPRSFGHRAGVEALRSVVSAASEIGIAVLTTYVFSTENWKRPAEEVSLLMTLFSEYLDNEIDELHQNGVQIRFIGKIEELASELQHKIQRAQALTADNTGLILNVAINYGGRAELVEAMQAIAHKVAANEINPADIDVPMIQNHLYTADLPDPDLLIRPSGDQRLSNFLLWQSAYAELLFPDIYWPDFGAEHLVEAIRNYQGRERRFGGLNNVK